MAEDILQAAFVKGLESETALREESSATAYFYKQLRRALVDHYRRRGVERRTQAREEAEVQLSVEDEHAWTTRFAPVWSVCIGTLPATQASVLRAVDIAGTPVADYARAEGVTANAAVSGCTAPARPCGSSCWSRAEPVACISASTANARGADKGRRE